MDSSTVGICVEPLSTHSDYRRRGIATTLMTEVYADALANGATHCVILASPMGRMLYQTLDYTIAGYHLMFEPLTGASYNTIAVKDDNGDPCGVSLD